MDTPGLFMAILAILIITSLFQPFIVGYMASKKGRDGLLYFILTAVLCWGVGTWGLAAIMGFTMLYGLNGATAALAIAAFFPILVVGLAPSKREAVRSRMETSRRTGLHRRKMSDRKRMGIAHGPDRRRRR